MENKTPEVRIQMLDGLSIECGDARRSYHTKAHQNWQVIAYLILNRDRAVSREELARLSPVSAYSTDASRMLRNRLMRIRRYLAPLSQQTGQDLLICTKTHVQWNPAVVLKLDTDEFMQLYKKSSASCNEEDIQKLRDMYGKGFLSMFDSVWFRDVQEFYQIMMDALPE